MVLVVVVVVVALRFQWIISDIGSIFRAMSFNVVTFLAVKEFIVNVNELCIQGFFLNLGTGCPPAS